MKFKATSISIIVLALLAALCSTLTAQSKKTVWDGVYTDAQAKQGQAVYNEQCASCHGDTLMGGESAPALAGGEFLSNWNGLLLGELFERVRTTMPQNKPGSLSRATNTLILAYLLHANQFPAGKTDLPQQTEVMNEIQITAQKPGTK